jgi:hypothetical protein
MVDLSLYQAIWVFIRLTLGLINHKVVSREKFFSSGPYTAIAGYD